jgi:hypothetical protein
MTMAQRLAPPASGRRDGNRYLWKTCGAGKNGGESLVERNRAIGSAVPESGCACGVVRLAGAVQPWTDQAAELLADVEALAEAGSFLVEVVLAESEPLELSEPLEPEEEPAGPAADEVEDPEALDERLSVR